MVGGGGFSMEDEMPSGVMHKRKAHDGGCTVVSYSSNIGQIATGGGDGMIKMWDARNHFEPKNQKIPLCTSISALKYNMNGNMVASAGTDL
jgi:WD40 repeat protein